MKPSSFGVVPLDVVCSACLRELEATEIIDRRRVALQIVKNLCIGIEVSGAPLQLAVQQTQLKAAGQGLRRQSTKDGRDSLEVAAYVHFLRVALDQCHCMLHLIGIDSVSHGFVHQARRFEPVRCASIQTLPLCRRQGLISAQQQLTQQRMQAKPSLQVLAVNRIDEEILVNQMSDQPRRISGAGKLTQHGRREGDTKARTYR